MTAAGIAHVIGSPPGNLSSSRLAEQKALDGRRAGGETALVPIGKHAPPQGLGTREPARSSHGVLGRLRNAITRALFAERKPRGGWTEPARPRPATLRETPSPERSLRAKREADAQREAAVIAAHRDRALRRVAAAASEACEDWSQGLDVDEAMARLRAELQSAAEYDV